MSLPRPPLRYVTAAVITIAAASAMAGCRPDSGLQGPAALKATDAPALFEEIQSEVGVDFIHDPGTPGTWYYPEIMIMGAAFLDYDHDGDLDIYLLNCGEPIMSGVKRDAKRAKIICTDRKRRGSSLT